MLETGWEKVPHWECLCVHRQQSLFLSVHVDDITLAGKKKHIDPLWKTLMKHDDLGGAHECQPNEGVVDECRKVFESRISAGATEKVS